MKKKEYRNVIKSKTSIQKALVDLLVKGKNFDSITIKDLALTANVTRGTFYNHYKSVIDVAEDIRDNFMNQLSTVLLHTDLSTESRKNFFNILNNFLEENKNHASVIAHSIPLKFLIDVKAKFNKAITDTFMKKLPEMNSRKNLIGEIRLFANGLAVSYIDAIMGDSKETISEVTETGYEMSNYLFN
ncbi:MAG: TetR/AcrR family transcriptional regulator [Bacilli bacterium]